MRKMVGKEWKVEEEKMEVEREKGRWRWRERMDQPCDLGVGGGRLVTVLQ